MEGSIIKGVGGFYYVSTGEGVITYAEDDKWNRTEYRGGFLDGSRHGRGVLKWKNGDVFDGMWEHDKRKGEGTLTKANGETVKGIWDCDGCKEAPKEQYTGEEKDGRPHGLGTMLYAEDDKWDRKEYRGAWR